MSTGDAALQLAREEGRAEGFETGRTHALDNARDDPSFRAIACAIVEDWARSLSGRFGLDVAFRMFKGEHVVGLWTEEGELAKAQNLFDALDTYDRALHEQAAP